MLLGASLNRGGKPSGKLPLNSSINEEFRGSVAPSTVPVPTNDYEFVIDRDPSRL